MLTRTLATDYLAGTNLKHNVAGASWIYLMPSLELDHIVCIGLPSPAALATLVRISGRVTIVYHNRDAVGQVQDEAPSDSAKVSVVQSISELLAMGDGHADLLYITDKQSVRRIQDDQYFQSELSRLAHTHGLIYFEFGPMSSLRKRRGLAKLGERSGSHQLLWLTPWHSEMETAVPVSARGMTARFFQHRLYSPSLDVSALKHQLRQLKRVRNSSSVVEQTKPPGKRFVRRLRAPFRAWFRTVALKFIKAFGWLERVLLKRMRIARRYGLFLQAHGDADGLQMGNPPSYLQAVAAPAGVDLSEHQWGFSARGSYSSRKLLFYLFKEQEQDADNSGSNYLVKMVREPAYNGRLENEYRALAWLEENGVRGKANFPKAEFFGSHNGLAIAGESYIDGVPFRAKTQATVDCPYARDVIDWIIELGAVTARGSQSTPSQLAAALEQLLGSFAELYGPPPEVYTFLANQIAHLGRNQGSIPLVFQHGDPGTWNMFVTNQGQIAVLDWEAAEPLGVPLWDLFYFLRSYSILVARKGGRRDRSKGYREQFLAGGAMGQLVADATARYCQRVALPRSLVEPLFYTCWMHRALKEASTLPVNRLASGRYFRLLRLTIEERENLHTLQWLFSDSK